jgi:hypothetical protein
MDHIRLEQDLDLEEEYNHGSSFGYASAPTSKAIAVPIEIKLKSLSVKLLYEACRVQKPSLQDLREFRRSCQVTFSS